MSGAMQRVSRFLDDDRNKALLVILFFFAWWVVFGLQSYELYSDDDMAHFLMARYALHHPMIYLDMWGRPLFTLLYTPIAQVGLHAARFQSALICASVCWLSFVYAKERGYARAWLAPLILAIMPRFYWMSFNLDTALLLCLVLTGALVLYAKERYALAAVVISLSPAARPEGVLFIMVFAAAFIYRKKWSAVPLAFAGPFIWNLVGFFTSGDPLWLIHNQPWTVPYGRGEFLHYFIRFMEITGPGHAALFIAGAVYCVWKWREKDNFLLFTMWLVYFLFLVFAWWQGAFSTLGLTRYFNGTAPIVAVITLAGINRLLDGERGLVDVVTAAAIALSAVFFVASGASYTVHFIVTVSVMAALRAAILLKGWTRPAMGAVVAGLFALGLMFYVPLHPPGLNAEHSMNQAAAQWYDTNAPGRYVLCTSLWFAHFAKMDPYDPARFAPLTRYNLDSAPAGTVVFWEPHYAGGDRYSGVSIEELANDPSYKLAWSNMEGYYFIFEKVGG